MHPLAPNLHDVSMEELLKKYSELQKRFNQAYKFGPYSVMPQIQMMMEHYQAEIDVRNRKQLEDMNKRAEEGGKGFKGIIDIS